MEIQQAIEYLTKFGLLATYLVLIGIIFAESGLLVGFFLPGDSLLFTAGFLASRDILNIVILVPAFFIAAVVGDSVGYAFGHKVGRRLFKREDSIFFHKDNLIRAKNFYETHGKKTIILARFVPVIRTFAPIVAGVGEMHYPTFLVFNIVGGILWAICIPLAGYFLGSLIPDVDRYLIPIIVLIVVLSVAPTAYHLLKDRNQRRQLALIIQKKILRR